MAVTRPSFVAVPKPSRIGTLLAESSQSHEFLQISAENFARDASNVPRQLGYCIPRRRRCFSRCQRALSTAAGRARALLEVGASASCKSPTLWRCKSLDSGGTAKFSGIAGHVCISVSRRLWFISNSLDWSLAVVLVRSQGCHVDLKVDASFEVSACCSNPNGGYNDGRF